MKDSHGYEAVNMQAPGKFYINIAILQVLMRTRDIFEIYISRY